MTVDYDLVILGGSAAARSAAIGASQLKARVALIEPQELSSAVYFHYSLVQAGRLARQVQRATLSGLDWGVDPTVRPTLAWGDLRERAYLIAQTQFEQRSPSLLAALGVDVIVGQGEFFRRPTLGVAVNGRELRSRAYLIATGSRPVIPKIDGLRANDDGTVGEAQSEIEQFTGSALPDAWTIVGGEPSGIELAQVFAQLGAQVTMIVGTSRLLPDEDAEAAHLIQAHLEADGVHILTETSVTQVKQLEGKKWLQAGHQAIETEEILFNVGRQPPLELLNLDAAGVRWQPWGIPVNSRLQTTNPRIYACGESLGGNSPHLAESEADVAWKNALFYPHLRYADRNIPWALLTTPELARVGLTETQAKQFYGDDLLILRQFAKTLTSAQLQGELTGLCKLIVRRNGRILGAHLVGTGASEAIGTIALAIQQNLSVQSIAQLAAITPTWTELIQQTAAQWQQTRRSSWQQDLLEDWFNLSRSWLS